TILATGDSSAPAVVPTLLSQATPYSRGVVSRWLRLAEKTAAALSAATPTTAPAMVLRTGSAVRPAPGRRDSRTPIIRGADLAPLASWMASPRSPRLTTVAVATSLVAARQAAGAAQPMVRNA